MYYRYIINLFVFALLTSFQMLPAQDSSLVARGERTEGRGGDGSQGGGQHYQGEHQYYEQQPGGGHSYREGGSGSEAVRGYSRGYQSGQSSQEQYQQPVYVPVPEQAPQQQSGWQQTSPY